MRCEGGENANAYAFVREICDERPSATVATGVAQSRQLVEPTKHLDEAVR